MLGKPFGVQGCNQGGLRVLKLFSQIKKITYRIVVIFLRLGDLKSRDMANIWH